MRGWAASAVTDDTGTEATNVAGGTKWSIVMPALLGVQSFEKGLKIAFTGLGF